MTRIYCVGSTCVGKTWAADLIAREYHLPKVSEIARTEAAKVERGGLEKVRLDPRETSAFQRAVFAEQLRQEATIVGDFVSDRAFDNLAYAAEFADCVGDLIELPECREYVRRVSRGLVLFFRPLPHTTADGVRPAVDLQLDTVHRIDGMVKLLLEMWKVPHIPIPPGTPKDRWTLIRAVVELRLAADRAAESHQP